MAQVGSECRRNSRHVAQSGSAPEGGSGGSRIQVPPSRFAVSIGGSGVIRSNLESSISAWLGIVCILCASQQHSCHLVVTPRFLTTSLPACSPRLGDCQPRCPTIPRRHSRIRVAVGGTTFVYRLH